MPQETQAANIVTAFDTFRQVPYVARTFWFHAQDVPEAGLFYGLVDAQGHKKRSFDVYVDVAGYESPAADLSDRSRNISRRLTP